MSAVVIDANLAIALAIPLDWTMAAREKFQEWSDRGVELLAPALWGYEVTSTLRKVIKSGQLAGDVVRQGLEEIFELGVQEVPATRDLHMKALDWAEQLGSLVAYDAAYVALAELRGVELWTADRGLVNAARALKIPWVCALQAGSGRPRPGR